MDKTSYEYPLKAIAVLDETSLSDEFVDSLFSHLAEVSLLIYCIG
jgi:hypothetical protein